MGMLDAFKESSYLPKLSMSDKIFIQPYNMWGLWKSNPKEHVNCFTI